MSVLSLDLYSAKPPFLTEDTTVGIRLMMLDAKCKPSLTLTLRLSADN